MHPLCANQNNTFDFSVKSSAGSYEDKQNGYIVFKSNDENKSIIYHPLIQTGDKLDVTSQMSINKSNGGFLITMTVDEGIMNQAEYPIKLDPSFEMYREKIPDTSVYSNQDVNSYLANYAVIGQHPALGEGWEYVRFRLNRIFYTRPENIIQSFFYFKCLDAKKLEERIYVYLPSDQWQSTQMLWNNRVEPSADISSSDEMTCGYCKIDLTYFTNKCFLDNTYVQEDWGVILKKSFDDYSIISTSDNSLYPAYIKIDLALAPKDFILKENINL